MEVAAGLSPRGRGFVAVVVWAVTGEAWRREGPVEKAWRRGRMFCLIARRRQREQIILGRTMAELTSQWLLEIPDEVATKANVSEVPAELHPIRHLSRKKAGYQYQQHSTGRYIE